MEFPVSDMTDSQFKLGNKYLENAEDFFYHFGFGITTLDIPAIFGDTKVSFLARAPAPVKSRQGIALLFKQLQN